MKTKKLRKILFLTLISLIFVSIITGNILLHAWTGYNTGFGTSSWSGFRVHTTTYYQDNTSQSVALRNVYTHIDNTNGSAQTNCALARVTQGDGTIPVWIRHYDTQVAPGNYYIDSFWLGEQSFNKYGEGVYTLSGATLTGNCGAFFGGWAVIFWADGTITQQWTE